MTDDREPPGVEPPDAEPDVGESGGPVADPADGGPSGAGVRRAAVVVLAVAVAVGAVLAGLLIAGSGGDPERQDYVIEIPAGTADRQAAGEDIELMPAELELQVGDTLRIVNRDDSYQTVGPYSVAPYQTVTQRFTRPGEILGACSLHPSGEVKIVITEA